MHRVGPPDPDALAGANTERHFERILEFYLEHRDLGERVPLSFGEEHALARLLAYCGLFREDMLGPGVFWLAARLGAATRQGTAKEHWPHLDEMKLDRKP